MLEGKLSGCSNTYKNFDGLVEGATDTLCQLDSLYKNGTVAQKREIIGSIFPGKLTFDGFQYRTTRLNDAVRLIYALGERFQQNKKPEKQQRYVSFRLW